MSDLPPEQPPEPPEQYGPEPVAHAQAVVDHPIRLVVDDDLQRSRLTVFFRLILAIPHFFWYLIWAIAVFFVALVAWFVALIMGRLPDGMHTFLAHFQVYATRLYGYVNLLADPYPPFSSGGDYPIDLRIAPPERQSRLKILFRIILGIPALVLTWVFGQVLQIIAFLGWFVCLAIGRMPKGMRDLGAYCLRYQQQTYCYMLLLTERYPSLEGTQP